MKSLRSVRLKKYGAVYNEYIKKNATCDEKIEPVKSSKKNLNEYQKFVKEESSKDKYKKMKGSERMSIISQEWEKKKRKDRKKK